MAITVTERGAINTAADDASIDIENVVLTVGRIYVAFLFTSGSGDPPPAVTSLSGTGLSMTKIATTGSSESNIGGGLYRAEAWIGKCTASGTVTMTIALDGTSLNSDVAIYELDGVNNSTGTSAVLQAVCVTSAGAPGTTVTATLAAFANSNNRPLAFAMHLANEVTAPDSGGGYTELRDASHASPSSGFEVQWHATLDDITPDFAWSTSSEFGAIALELAVPPGPFPTGLFQSARRRQERPHPPRARGRLFAEWFKPPPAQSLSIVSFAELSRPVELVEGDEIRITLSGPPCDQPQARITLGVKHIH